MVLVCLNSSVNLSNGIAAIMLVTFRCFSNQPEEIGNSALSFDHKIKPFFRLYQQNKCYESKVKFSQASNHCERVPELANLHMLIKQKSPSFPRN